MLLVAITGTTAAERVLEPQTAEAAVAREMPRVAVLMAVTTGWIAAERVPEHRTAEAVVVSPV